MTTPRGKPLPVEWVDDTLTYYSAGLGSEVTVPVERPDMDPLTWVVDADDVRDMEQELCECELCRARAEACSICRAEAEAGASPGTGDGHPAISALELAARIAEGGQTP